MDADTHGVPIEANGLFCCAGTTEVADRKASFRHADSSDDWSRDIEAKTNLQAGAGSRTDNLWNEYLEHAQLEVFIAGYTVDLTI